MSSLSSSPLLLLPYELQARILIDVFDGAESVLDEAEHPPHPTGTHHLILLTCSYLYETFAALYYQHLTLHINHPSPRITKWSNSKSPTFSNHIRRIGLEGHVQLHENDACVCSLYQASPTCPGTADTIFNPFPNLTDVVVDGSRSYGRSLNDIWILPCEHYIPPDDEGRFVELLAKFGRCMFQRPGEVPGGLRCWEKQEYLLHWICPGEDDQPVGGRGEECKCPFKGIAKMDPRRYNNHSVTVKCH